MEPTTTCHGRSNRRRLIFYSRGLLSLAASKRTRHQNHRLRPPLLLLLFLPTLHLLRLSPPPTNKTQRWWLDACDWSDSKTAHPISLPSRILASRPNQERRLDDKVPCNGLCYPCALVVILFAGLPPVQRGTSGEASSLESSSVLVYRTLIPVSTSVSFSGRATTSWRVRPFPGRTWQQPGTPGWLSHRRSGRGVKERPSPFLPASIGDLNPFLDGRHLRLSDGVAPRDTAGSSTSSPDASCDFSHMASTWEGREAPSSIGLGSIR